VHVHPQGGKIFYGPNLQGKVVSAPERQSKSPFLGNWGDVHGGRGYLGSFSVCFDGDDPKKGRQLFGGKSASKTKSWLRLLLPDDYGPLHGISECV